MPVTFREMEPGAINEEIRRSQIKMGGLNDPRQHRPPPKTLPRNPRPPMLWGLTWP